MDAPLKKTVTVASPAGATQANALVSDGLNPYDAVEIIYEGQGHAGGTLDAYVQARPERSLGWYDVAHFPQLAAGAAAIVYRASITRHQQTAAPVVIGKDSTPALAANTVVAGTIGIEMRVLLVGSVGGAGGINQTFRFTFYPRRWS